MSFSTSSLNLDEVWIYHERQEALLCGQHALNNLWQGPIWSAVDLASIAHRLDQLEWDMYKQDKDATAQMTQNLVRESQNVDASGNFSIQVLQTALQEQMMAQNISTSTNNNNTLLHYTPSLVQQSGFRDVTDFQGFLLHKADHWFAIRRIADRFFDLNSMHSAPSPISAFSLGKTVDHYQADGYTVFCVPKGLPNVGHVGQYAPKGKGTTKWWHAARDALQNNLEQVKKQGHKELYEQQQAQAAAAQGDTSALAALQAAQNDNNNSTNGNKKPKTDPWESLKGSGMRLDGKTTTAATMTNNHGNIVEGLTEEEQLQLALQLSVAAAAEQANNSANSNDNTNINLDSIPIPDEPPAGATNVCRIQFRFNNKRVVRRFDRQQDTVQQLYAFCAKQQGSTNVDLRAGFPPASLKEKQNMTLVEAQLGTSEAIQVVMT